MLSKLPKSIIVFCLLLVICIAYCPTIYAATCSSGICDANSSSVLAAVKGPTATQTPTPTVASSSGGIGLASSSAATTPQFVQNQEVTFIGKSAARSGLFLDWALSDTNYGWEYLPGNSPNSLQQFWGTITFRIIFPILIFMVLIAAVVLIVTRGRSLTLRRFIIRFVLVVILVYFSFAIVRFLYEAADIIQLFFLQSPNNPGHTISQKDLLFVGWDYSTFQGLILNDASAAESAFMALLLVKLTSITYYTMVGILLVRKIILWFFIILSPIFPLLLFFRPVRNTAKIWLGEFFRWLLYAPLFAVLLGGLVHVWFTNIPLNFTNYDPTHTAANIAKGGTSDSFPTAINILLGAPKQQVDLTNSVNYVETFAEYVVALLMLWVVIILPFILLQIFLDYLATVSIGENTFTQQIIARGSSIIKPPPPSPISPPPPTKYQPAGLARSLPFGASLQRVRESLRPVQQNVPLTTQANADILKLTNLSIPTMQDIARYEMSKIASSRGQGQIANKFEQTLQRIANPVSAAGTQQETYHQIRTRLLSESQKGNMLAKNILQAAATTASISLSQQSASIAQQAVNTIFNPDLAASQLERQKATQLKQTIVQESEKGNTTANTVISALNTINKTELANMQQVLEKLANPGSIPNINQQVTFTRLRDALQHESQQGNKVAESLLTAAKQVSTTGVNMTTLTQVREQLKQESKKGNKVAKDVLSTSDSGTTLNTVKSLIKQLQSAKQKGDPLATSILDMFVQKGVQTSTTAISGLPLSNRIQTVSIEDYEAVRKMWTENYQKMDIPPSWDGTIRDRKSWLTADNNDINETINLLSSTDQQQIDEGMQRVSGILPFLLIGGFSHNEITTYLKAKQQAAKEVLEQVESKEEEEETQVTRESAQRPKEGHLTVELPTEESESNSISPQSQQNSTLPNKEMAKSPSEPIEEK